MSQHHVAHDEDENNGRHGLARHNQREEIGDGRGDESMDPISSEDPLYQQETNQERERMLHVLTGQVVHNQGKGINQEQRNGVLKGELEG